jgi:hypothetical protein
MSDTLSDRIQRASDDSDIYWDALKKAVAELEHLRVQKQELAFRMSQLNETVKALWPLVRKDSNNINSYTLTNAVRFVFNGAERTLSVADVRNKLEELGFDLSQYDNPLANIGTAMSRMVEADEIVKVESDDKKKKFEAGPGLKDVPAPSGESIENLTVQDLDNLQKEGKK